MVSRQRRQLAAQSSIFGGCGGESCASRKPSLNRQHNRGKRWRRGKRLIGSIGDAPTVMLQPVIARAIASSPRRAAGD